MIGAMQFYTFQNFGEYVDQIELDKLSGLISRLENEYQKQSNWESLRHNHAEWTRIFIDAGLIDSSDARLDHPRPRQGPPPPGVRPPFKPPRQVHNPRATPGIPGPGPIPDSLEASPRLSLFDENHGLVMGRARSKQGHVFKPILVNDKTVGYLGLRKLEDLSNPLDRYFIRQQKQVIYLVGGVFLILSVLISFVLASQLLSPIKKLSHATRRLSKRNFDTKIKVTSTDELGQLADDFNAMIAQLGAYELKQKQWLSDISHELRTPLSILVGEIDAIRDGIRDPEPAVIKSIQAEVFHLNRLIDDLHTLSVEETKTLQLERRPVDIGRLLEETQEKFTKEFSQKGIVIAYLVNLSDCPKISGDPDRLIQLFSNILENSLRYTDAPGTLTIKGMLHADCVEICFEDTRPGVPEDSINRIFNRLFRADPSRSRKTGGSGIGLAICKHIVERHDGKIIAMPATSGGLKIRISFPINQ